MKRYNKEEKAKLVEAWEISGKSKWTFAKENEIVPQTFCKWIARKEETVHFVEVKSKQNFFGENSQEIILERGEVRIRVPYGIHQQGIELVKVLWKLLA